MTMICGGAVIRPGNGKPTKIVGTGECEVFIDGAVRREYALQWRKMRGERERARVVEENRNCKNARRLAEMLRAEEGVGMIRRAARKIVNAYAVSYAVAAEIGCALIRLMIRGGLIEPVNPEEI